MDNTKDTIGICISCAFCKQITMPPSPGGFSDGVDCVNPQVVKEQGGEAEYREYGSVNLWRIEVISDGEAVCEYWSPKNGN